MEYDKSPLNYDQQVDLLASRGLQMPDKPKAVALLSRISYYRLSAYRFPYQYGRDQFKPDITIDDIYSLYLFDHKLRILVLDYLETIEVAIRTSLTYYLSHTYGAFGYLDKSIFAQRFEHDEWLRDLRKVLKRSRETFILHYETKYKLSNDYPIWMATEVISFGALSKLYAGLKNADKQKIADAFNVHREVFRTWFHAMVYVRNICAHHSRLWNKELAIRPDIPEKDSVWKSLFPEPNKRVFAPLTIMQYCLNQIHSENNFKSHLMDLLKSNPTSDSRAMGFPANWDQHQIWNS